MSRHGEPHQKTGGRTVVNSGDDGFTTSVAGDFAVLFANLLADEVMGTDASPLSFSAIFWLYDLLDIRTELTQESSVEVQNKELVASKTPTLICPVSLDSIPTILCTPIYYFPRVDCQLEIDRNLPRIRYLIQRRLYYVRALGASWGLVLVYYFTSERRHWILSGNRGQIEPEELFRPSWTKLRLTNGVNATICGGLREGRKIPTWGRLREISWNERRVRIFTMTL